VSNERLAPLVAGMRTRAEIIATPPTWWCCPSRPWPTCTASATWGISEALIPYLRTVLDGPDAWDSDPTIRLAVEIRDGVIQNPKILSFQGRHHEHPHPWL
jgi:hypothetical protein